MPLTPLALALLLVPALLPLIGPVASRAGVLGPAVLLAILIVIVLDHLTSRRLASLELERVTDDKLSLGADNRVEIRVRNRCPLRLSLLVKDDPPPAFVTDRRTFSLALDPYGQDSVAYHTRPLARGRYAFGSLHVRGRSRLGLSYWQRRFPAPAEVAVYPNLLEVRRYQLLARSDRLRQAGFRLTRRLGQGTEFESLREYSPDDDFRSIDWKATARRRHPISRQYETERSQTVIIMIDAGRLMSTLIGDLSRLDYALNAALMLAYVAVERDDAVGLIAFADDVKAFVPPRKGHRQVGLITEALYDLQPALVEPDYAEAFTTLSARARKRALVVCFTDLVDVEASSRLLGHLTALAPHHLPLLITLRDRDLQQAAQARPAEVADAYQRALAAQVLHDRETALGVLRQRGVMVLDALPEKLTVAAVNQYLGLKAQGRL
ncbi:MAG: DUF58 domain-containing protein [Armatimonadetes bacterium]|nr:DUF58 domain-containing protein [Armatimonadota bacterium]